MDHQVFFLVLGSALCHAFWNFTARKAAGNLAVIWTGLLIACLFLFPFVLYVTIKTGISQTVSLKAFLCILATGLIHAVYFRLLSSGYKYGEISLVYPIARGSGIALTALLAFLLLKENFSITGLMGILFISLGILALSLFSDRTQHNARSILLALAIGVSIVAYSVIDKIGVSLVNPVIYIWAMFLIAALSLSPLLLNRLSGNPFRISKANKRSAFIIGIGSAVAYLMILFAYTHGQLGYIVAVRELAVVFGALAGIIFLKERFTFLKGLMIVMVVTGILLIKLG